MKSNRGILDLVNVSARHAPWGMGRTCRQANTKMESTTINLKLNGSRQVLDECHAAKGGSSQTHKAVMQVITKSFFDLRPTLPFSNSSGSWGLGGLQGLALSQGACTKPQVAPGGHVHSERPNRVGSQ